MLVEMIRIKFNNDGSYGVAKILINPQHIVFLTEDNEANKLLHEGEMGLHKNTMFTKVRLRDQGLINEITVIGAPEELGAKIFSQKKRLLRG